MDYRTLTWVAAQIGTSPAEPAQTIPVALTPYSVNCRCCISSAESGTCRRTPQGGDRVRQPVGGSAFRISELFGSVSIWSVQSQMLGSRSLSSGQALTFPMPRPQGSGGVLDGWSNALGTRPLIALAHIFPDRLLGSDGLAICPYSIGLFSMGAADTFPSTGARQLLLPG